MDTSIELEKAVYDEKVFFCQYIWDTFAIRIKPGTSKFEACWSIAKNMFIEDTVLREEVR